MSNNISTSSYFGFRKFSVAATSAVRPNHVRPHLQDNGSRLKSCVEEFEEVWELSDTDVRVVLPLEPSDVDYASRMAETIVMIADAEERPNDSDLDAAALNDNHDAATNRYDDVFNKIWLRFYEEF